jgi:hypothetical protein
LKGLLPTNLASLADQENAMFYDLSLLRDEHLVFLAVVVGVIATALAWILTAVAVQCRRWRQSRQMLAFKREMIEHGLSPEQVQRLLNAAPAGMLSRLAASAADGMATLLLAAGAFLRRMITACQWGSVHRQRQELEFKARMIERGLSVAEVERLYEAKPVGWPGRLIAVAEGALTQACAACRRFRQSLRPVTSR